MRDDFNKRTKEILAKRSGMRCSNPKCRKQTAGPSESPTEAINIGVAAHISAASSGGPRFDDSLTPAQRSNMKNGIWLCQSCAKLIDSDQKGYSVDLLMEWKKEAEKEARNLLESNGISKPESFNPFIGIGFSAGESKQTVSIEHYEAYGSIAHFCMIIRNYGNSPALNVTIEQSRVHYVFDSKLKEFDMLDIESHPKKLMLNPGQDIVIKIPWIKRRTSVDLFRKLLRDNSTEFYLDISYSNLNGSKWRYSICYNYSGSMSAEKESRGKWPIAIKSQDIEELH